MYIDLRQRYPYYQFGRGTYDGNDLRVYSWGEGASLKIGSFCSIANGVQIFLGGDHRVDWVTTYPFNKVLDAGKHIEGHPKTKGDVEIGNDVWIGTEAVILSGVTIGDGAVIGARSVVTKKVPPYSIVAGNPARVVRNRFDEETIERLLKIQWWNWSDEQIEKSLTILLNSDIKAFFQTAEDTVKNY
jgi:acetyltransferase-like isoleucine patch superfamily enzyme